MSTASRDPEDGRMPTEHTVSLCPAIAARVQELSDMTSFSPDEIVDRILSRHFEANVVNSSTQTAPTSEPQSSNEMVAVSSLPALEAAPKADPLPIDEFSGSQELPARPATETGEKLRYSLCQITHYDHLDMEIVFWGGKELDPPTPNHLLDTALLDFCTRTSQTQNQDIEMIRKHLGLSAKRHHGARPPRRTLVKSCGFSFKKLDIKDITHAAFKAARTLNVPLEVTFRLVSEDLELPVGARIVVRFDPEEIVDADSEICGISQVQKPAPDFAKIKPGACVRVRYEDTLEVKQIYIKKRHDDVFLDDNVHEITNGSPLAQSLEEGTPGSIIQLTVGENKQRTVTILEIWNV